jgi:mRNA-degrading endonuclease RelE of RelBE toxin-antitoxin system
MRPVLFHRHAANYFKRLPADRWTQVLAAIELLRPIRPLTEIPNVRAMHGEWQGCWRIRIGSLRMIVRLIRQSNGIEVL